MTVDIVVANNMHHGSCELLADLARPAPVFWQGSLSPDFAPTAVDVSFAALDAWRSRVVRTRP